MNPIWWRAFAWVVVLGVLAAFLDPLIGTVNALWLYAIGITLGFLRDQRFLGALWRWAGSGRNRRLPPAAGPWDELFARLYRQDRTTQKQHAALTEALVSFRRAAQALPDGVITLNEDNQILWCNAQAESHFGLKLAKDGGQNVTNLVRAPDFLAYLARGDWDSPIVLRVRSNVGQATDRLFSVQLVGYGDHQKLLLSRDVTKIERLETMRRDFVANVSHELKTPLTVLAGFLETIQEVKLPPRQQQHYLQLMTEQADRMQHLVADLLTLSALEANSNPVDEIIPMDALVARISDTALSLSAGRHALSFDVEPGLNLIGSETEIASALTNLVTNAVRYTPDGGAIQVSWGVTVNQSDSADRGATFAVSDNGIGIPAQHLPRLTERFYRVDRGRSRESGGTGLGLAIVKHALTRHQARLDITSTVGVGSRFAAVFPERRLARAEPRTELRGEVRIAPGDASIRSA